MAKNKQMCRGCRDDYYNQRTDGGCWCFDNARIVKRVRVGIWESPPYAADRAQEYLSCFNADGDVMLSVNDVRVKPAV